MKRHNSPILYGEPDRFFSHFLQHYLLLGLTQLFTVSLLAENEYIIRHLERAIHRLDEKLAKLSSRVRTLRQEEIIEEIGYSWGVALSTLWGGMINYKGHPCRIL